MGHQAVRLDGDLGGPMLNQVTVPLADYEASAAFIACSDCVRSSTSAPRYARFESAGGATLSIEVAGRDRGQAAAVPRMRRSRPVDRAAARGRHRRVRSGGGGLGLARGAARAIPRAMRSASIRLARIGGFRHGACRDTPSAQA